MVFPLRLVCVLSLVPVLLGSGCSLSSLVDPSIISTTSSSTKDQSSPRASWQSIGPGMERLEAMITTTTGTMLRLYRLDPTQYQPHVEQAIPPRNVSVWSSLQKTAALVVNGVYFHEDYLPSGAMRVSGTAIGTRQFDLDKSGTILFNPLRLVDTKEYAIHLNEYADVVQSYPFLLKNGIVAVKEESGKVARRSFLGLDRAGRMYVGIVPNASVSLRELALALTTLPVEWTNVLNLDGGPSTGLSVHTTTTEELFDSYVPVPNIIWFGKK